MIRDNTNGHKSCPRTNSKVHAARYTFHIGADAKLYSTDSHSLYDGVEDFCIDQRNDRNTYGEEHDSYYYNYPYEENDLNYTIMEDENSIPDSNLCKNSYMDGETLPFLLFCATPILHVPKCCKENEMINVRYVSHVPDISLLDNATNYLIIG